MKFVFLFLAIVFAAFAKPLTNSNGQNDAHDTTSDIAKALNQSDRKHGSIYIYDQRHSSGIINHGANFSVHHHHHRQTADSSLSIPQSTAAPLMEGTTSMFSYPVYLDVLTTPRTSIPNERYDNRNTMGLFYEKSFAQRAANPYLANNKGSINGSQQFFSSNSRSDEGKSINTLVGNFNREVNIRNELAADREYFNVVRDRQRANTEHDRLFNGEHRYSSQPDIATSSNDRYAKPENRFDRGKLDDINANRFASSNQANADTHSNFLYQQQRFRQDHERFNDIAKNYENYSDQRRGPASYSTTTDTKKQQSEPETSQNDNEANEGGYNKQNIDGRKDSEVSLSDHEDTTIYSRRRF
jgi:hypothetical protein